MIIAFVPCRLKSSRFPNKALQEINGISAIERCLINTKSIPGVDKVFLATSTNSEDDELENYNLEGEIEVLRGPEDDILERILPTVKELNPKHVIRVTGDCPVVSPELGNLTIQNHLLKNCDASFILSNVAIGLSIEIYKAEAILKLRELFDTTDYSEYLIYYFINNPKYFSLNDISAPKKYDKPWRLTLDHHNDLELFDKIFKTLDIGRRPVLFDDLDIFFKKNPEASKINIDNIVKYKIDKQLIDKIKKETTIDL